MGLDFTQGGMVTTQPLGTLCLSPGPTPTLADLGNSPSGKYEKQTPPELSLSAHLTHWGLGLLDRKHGGIGSQAGTHRSPTAWVDQGQSQG